MIETWIILSTVCLYQSPYLDENKWAAADNICVQAAEFSLSSKTVEGQTVYRILPATATICQYPTICEEWHTHLWVTDRTMNISKTSRRFFVEHCIHCGEHRRVYIYR